MRRARGSWLWYRAQQDPHWFGIASDKRPRLTLLAEPGYLKLVVVGYGGLKIAEDWYHLDHLRALLTKIRTLRRLAQQRTRPVFLSVQHHAFGLEIANIKSDDAGANLMDANQPTELPGSEDGFPSPQ
jgi:hypothetical protein